MCYPGAQRKDLLGSRYDTRDMIPMLNITPVGKCIFTTYSLVLGTCYISGTTFYF